MSADPQVDPPTVAAPTKSTVHIGTRASELAVIQTKLVIEKLKEAWPDKVYEMHAIKTMGDKDKVTALNQMGAKSLWTFELEEMLMKGEIDFIVHCLKDIPTHIPQSLTLGAIFNRESPYDALVLSPRIQPPPYDLATSVTPDQKMTGHAILSAMPAGSLIGTSSVRRSAQLKRLHPHLEFESCRGNVGTRLSKLDREGSQFSAIILAVAGLQRLGLGDRISAELESGRKGKGDAVRISEGEDNEKDPATELSWHVLHAVGQGALALEMREADTEVAKLLVPLHETRTAIACLAERSLMRTLEGGCSVPIGVETEWVHESGQGSERESDTLLMRAIVVSLDSSRHASASIKRRLPLPSAHQQLVEGTQGDQQDPQAAADEMGKALAAKLVARGADSILGEINLNRPRIEEQQGGA